MANFFDTKVIGYSVDDIFEIAKKFAQESNPVYIASDLENLLRNAQSNALDYLVDKDKNGTRS